MASREKYINNITLSGTSANIFCNQPLQRQGWRGHLRELWPKNHPEAAENGTFCCYENI